MISAIRIVPVPLYFFRRNENVLSVLSTFCVNVAVDVLDLSRIAVRIIAAANRRTIGHVPCRIELLVQELILRRMMAKPTLGLALSVLRLGPRRQQATETAR